MIATPCPPTWRTVASNLPAQFRRNLGVSFLSPPPPPPNPPLTPQQQMQKTLLCRETKQESGKIATSHQKSSNISRLPIPYENDKQHSGFQWNSSEFQAWVSYHSWRNDKQRPRTLYCLDRSPFLVKTSNTTAVSIETLFVSKLQVWSSHNSLWKRRHQWHLSISFRSGSVTTACENVKQHSGFQWHNTSQ